METNEIKTIKAVDSDFIRQRNAAIKAGVPVVDLSIFDVLDKYRPSDAIMAKSDKLTDEYRKYLDLLYYLDDDEILKYMKKLKDYEIIFSQAVEGDDMQKLKKYKEAEKEVCAIDTLIANAKNNYAFYKDDFVFLHDVLLRGTKSESNTGLRKTDDHYVGSAHKDENFKTVYDFSYFPIETKNINDAVDMFLKYFNAHLGKIDRSYDVWLKPIIYSGILACLQVFPDGNSRYGRLIEHVELWNLLNRVKNSDLALPIIYTTEQYYEHKHETRDLVARLVEANNNELWNEWVNTNMTYIFNTMLTQEAEVEKMVRKKYR